MKRITITTIIALCITILSAMIVSASEPLILGGSFPDKTSNFGITYLNFTVLREYKNERVCVNIYEGSRKSDAIPSNLVKSFTEELYSFGPTIDSVSFLWYPDTKTEGLTLVGRRGNYVIEYYMEYRTFNQWFETARRKYAYITASGWCNEHNYSLYEKSGYENTATCYQSGKAYYICTKCGDMKKEDSPTKHTFNEGVITVSPTCSYAGTTTYTCTKCSTQTTMTIPINKEAHAWETIEVAPTLTRAGATKFKCMLCGIFSSYENPVPPQFIDIEPDSFYESPFIWAHDKNIVAGTSASTFSPYETCSKAQILTFLYRAKGSPSPITTINPFSDVAEFNYYYNAALWAYENGIVEGTVFSPDEPCTRAMCADYMWKASGSPSTEYAHGFYDVASWDSYDRAVAWAVENGVTTGTGNNNFSPAEICTRAQIVTFLYRLMNA